MMNEKRVSGKFFFPQEMVYYGEEECQEIYKSGKKKGISCENKAYYQVGTKLCCGLHAKKKGTVLPKNPYKKENQAAQMAEHYRIVEDIAAENREMGRRGDIKMEKLRMRKAAPSIEGYVTIFPNFKHGNRKDGIGMPTLSPMSLGPVSPTYTWINEAENIENFHQGAKIFPGEVGPDGKITRASLKMRERMYTDPIPYRHKFKVPYFTGSQESQGNIPLFSVYYSPDKDGVIDPYTGKGKEYRYSYIESRLFYCLEYEKLAREEEDFAELVGLLDEGYNLLIVGYDGFPSSSFPDNITEEERIDLLWQYYNDATRPFGHEIVLYTLLVIDNPDNYPWWRYYRENEDIYTDVLGEY